MEQWVEEERVVLQMTYSKEVEKEMKFLFFLWVSGKMLLNFLLSGRED